MGNAQSGFIYRKLSRELPPLKQMGHDDNWNYKDMGMKVFADEKDREQFICKSNSNTTSELSKHVVKIKPQNLHNYA